jgi:hypothetical protein
MTRSELEAQRDAASTAFVAANAAHELVHAEYINAVAGVKVAQTYLRKVGERLTAAQQTRNSADAVRSKTQNALSEVRHKEKLAREALARAQAAVEIASK